MLSIAVRLLLLVATTLLSSCTIALADCGYGGGLCYDFYKYSCPKVEDLVRKVVEAAVQKDRRMGASLLRLHFHDCFVRGCDASILLDSTSNNEAEKDFPANNPSVRGYDVIDAAKELVEKYCPGTVSCADIVAIAGRDGTYALGGPYWDLRFGRKDGTISRSQDALRFLPSPDSNLDTLTNAFAIKGLSTKDMVALSGGHTIGGSHCSSFRSRLYNFSGTGQQDPSLDSYYARYLKSRCPKDGEAYGDTIVDMDYNSAGEFDSQYYSGLFKKYGLFSSDAALLDSSYTKGLSYQFSYSEGSFFDSFAAAMIKMSEIEVKTGSEGEIRKYCHAKNSYY